MARDDLFFRIRLPEALKSEIQRLAVANHRSANAEIVARLSESIALGLSGHGVTANAATQSLDDSEQGKGDTFAERLANIEDKKRVDMIGSLQEMLGILMEREAKKTPSPKTPAKKTPAKK